MACTFGNEFLSAVQVAPRITFESVLAPAMRVECRGAIWTHDSEVLEAVICGDAVYVVEDQRHPSTIPLLALSAEFTLSPLQPSFVEAMLQPGSRVMRVRDQDLVERYRVLAPRTAPHPIGIKVIGRDAVFGDQFPHRRVVAAGGPLAETPQCGGQAGRTSDGIPNILLGVSTA